MKNFATTRKALIFEIPNGGFPDRNFHPTEADLDRVVENFHAAENKPPVAARHKLFPVKPGEITNLWRKGKQIWADIGYKPGAFEFLTSELGNRLSASFNVVKWTLNEVSHTPKPEIESAQVFESEEEEDTLIFVSEIEEASEEQESEENFETPDASKGETVLPEDLKALQERLDAQDAQIQQLLSDRAADKAEIETLKSENFETNRARLTDTNSAYLDTLVKARKITPAQKALALSILVAGANQQFEEAGESVTVSDQFRKFLEAQPVNFTADNKDGKENVQSHKEAGDETFEEGEQAKEKERLLKMTELGAQTLKA